MGQIGDFFDASYQGLEPDEIAQVLDGVAYEVREGNYTKRLTPEELTEKRRLFAELNMEKNDIETEIKDFAARKKIELKPIVEEVAGCLSCIKTKTEVVNGKLFGIDNQDTQEMEYYDTTGVLVDIRPLKREEKQRKLFQLEKKQGNGE